MCGSWPFSGDLRISEVWRWATAHVDANPGHSVAMYPTDDHRYESVVRRVDDGEAGLLPLED